MTRAELLSVVLVERFGTLADLEAERFVKPSERLKARSATRIRAETVAIMSDSLPEVAARRLV